MRGGCSRALPDLRYPTALLPASYDEWSLQRDGAPGTPAPQVRFLRGSMHPTGRYEPNLLSSMPCMRCELAQAPSAQPGQSKRDKRLLLAPRQLRCSARYAAPWRRATAPPKTISSATIMAMLRHTGSTRLSYGPSILSCSMFARM